MHGTRTAYTARVRSGAGRCIGITATNWSDLIVVRTKKEMTLSVVLDERYADLAAQFQRAQIGILRNTLKKYGSGAAAALDAPEPVS